MSTRRHHAPDDWPVLYVCGDTARSPARSGIQTVVRSLAAAFGTQRAPVRPVVWKTGWNHLRALPPDWSSGLGAEPLCDPSSRAVGLWHSPRAWPAALLAGGRGNRVPVHLYPRSRRLPAGGWVLLPELVYRPGRLQQLIDYVHQHGWRLAAILHDAIPVQHPEFVPPGLPETHANYLRALTRADLILPNSEATAQGWREFITRENLPAPLLRVCTLACDLPGVPRVRVPSAITQNQSARLLCVSTLEPRKNHRTLFAAYELAANRRPDLALELDLVGSPYVDAQDIADAARALVSRWPGRVRWHERTEHTALRRLYTEADFTVYPSVLEGFGLPVIESLWFGRPCVCADFGVMAENAAGGGCLTVDVRDPHALADAILALAGSAELRQRLAIEATTRPLKTWHEYADEVLGALGSR